MSDWRGILRTEDIKFVRLPFGIANRTRRRPPPRRPVVTSSAESGRRG